MATKDTRNRYKVAKGGVDGGWCIVDTAETPSEHNYHGVVAYGFRNEAEAQAECALYNVRTAVRPSARNFLLQQRGLTISSSPLASWRSATWLGSRPRCAHRHRCGSERR